MKRLPANTFDRPWLLLCEGETDRVFFNRLIADMGSFNNQFDVQFPCRNQYGHGGRSNFGPFIDTAVATSPTFRQNVKAILIATDSDLDTQASFQAVVSSLQTSRKIAVPTAPKTFASMPGQAHVFVVMIPEGRPGALEDWCIEAALNRWQFRPALDAYTAATPAGSWDAIKKSKMRMHSIIAATCEPNPEAGLAHHWKEDAAYHLPINDPIFSEIRNTLNQFAASAPV